MACVVCCRCCVTEAPMSAWGVAVIAVFRRQKAWTCVWTCVCGHVGGHMYGHVCGHVRGHVRGHVCGMCVEMCVDMPVDMCMDMCGTYVWTHTITCGVVWLGLAWHGMMWHDVTWHCMTCYHVASSGTACVVGGRCCVDVCVGHCLSSLFFDPRRSRISGKACVRLR